MKFQQLITRIVQRLENTQIIQKGFVFVMSVMMMTAASANPVFTGVTSGLASVTQTGNSTVVVQKTPNAILQWGSFNIGSNESTRFIQPSSTSVALNRISPSAGVSQIFGSLSSNGQIILVNPAGIYFGPNAMVNVGGIIASTSDITNANFNAGKDIFSIPSASAASIVNKGMIRTSDYGLVALLGTNVTNTGLIQAEMGAIVLGSGNTFTLSFNGDQLVNFTVNQAASTKGQITNTGSLLADGGQVLVTASGAQGVLDSQINMQGLVEANSVSQQGGEIVLSAESGNVTVGGNLVAEGSASGTKGGTIKVLGQSVTLSQTANLDASGIVGGGTILIGGDKHGTGSDMDAVYTTVSLGSIINASAMTSGNGGQVVVWSNDITNYLGKIIAIGGSSSGSGGSVEVSGKTLLNYKGTVNLSAAHGLMGSLLLDPENLTIVNSGSTTASSANYTYTSTSDNSILNVSDLNAALENASVVLQTGSTGSQAGDITLSANTVINWNTPNTLTMTAYHNVNINGTILNSNAGSLTIEAGNTGNGLGTITFGSAGQVIMSGGGVISLYYNPAVFGTEDADLANSDNSANASHFLIDSSTTFLPYMLVNNVNQLQAINNNLAGDYALATNIDASQTSSWNAGSGFVPLGTANVNFTGNFDGQDFVVNNLFSTQNGLFGVISSNSTVQNLGLTNASIVLTNAGSNQYGSSFGILAGNNMGSLINVYATGSIANTDTSGSEIFGGLVGTNSGMINVAYSQGSVINYDSFAGQEQFGGLVGLNLGSISDANSSDLVSNISGSSGAEVFGGLVGTNYSNNSSATLSIAFSTGLVSNQDSGGSEIFGGLIGQIQRYQAGLNSVTYGFTTGNITNTDTGAGAEIFGGVIGVNNLGAINIAYATGNLSNSSVSGSAIFGGVVGENAYQSVISNSYSTSNVTNAETSMGTEEFGGFVGLNNGTIISAFSQGTVSNSDKAGQEQFGGFGGNNSGTGTVVSGYATGTVTNNEQGGGNEQFGGLVGNNSGQILSSYATNIVSNNDTGGNEYFGGLVGYNSGSITGNFNNGSISGTYTTGNVTTNDSTGDENFGGLVGYNSLSGDINYAYSTGTISGLSPAQQIGGLVGYNDGDISYVYNTGPIHVSASYVGGLIGYNDIDAYVSYAYNLSNVTSSGSYVGGLIGYNNGIITNAFNSGTVTTSGNIVGGLIGDNDAYGQIYNTYNIGTVTGGQIVGGLIGENLGFVTTSYNAGKVNGSGSTGGFVGIDNGNINASFFDVDTSGLVNSGAGSGSSIIAGCFSGVCQTAAPANVTFVDLSSYLTYTSQSWDITDTPSNNGIQPTNSWFIFNNTSRPILMLEYSQTITDAHQLQLAATNPDGSYIIANNIDLSGTSNPADIWGGISGGGFVPIGDSVTPFAGTMNGQGFNLSNYFSAKGGVFGDTFATAIIENFSMTNASLSVTGNGSDFGLVVDNNGGLVTSIAATGTVSASNASDVGGLVGLNENTVTDSSMSGSVQGAANVGGLIGENDSSITSSNSVGSTIGANNAGGLVGLNTGSIASANSADAVTGSNTNTGGLVGSNTGNVSSSFSTGSVSGNLSAGGLVGSNTGSIINAYSTGAVSGFDVVGGLIGIDNLASSSVSDSYSVSSVNGNTNVGGFIGLFESGTVNSSFSTGSVTGSANVGGFIGSYNYVASASVNNVYSLSPVNGVSNVGGLIGYASGSTATLNNAYSAGWVKGTLDVGGLIGNSSIITTDSFFDNLTSGQTIGVGAGSSGQTGVSGQSTFQMISQSTFCASGTCSGGTTGFDFTAVTGVWGIVQGASYPYLAVFYPNLPRVVSGISASGAGSSIELEVNSSLVPNQDNLPGGSLSEGTTTAAANGFYYFLESNNVIPDTNASNNPSLIVTKVIGSPSAAVTYAGSVSGSSITGLNILNNDLAIGDASAKTFTSAFLASISPDSILNALYSPSGVNLNFVNNVGFASNVGATLNLSGNITTSGSSSSITLLGPLVMSANAFIASGGNMTISGGVTGSAYTLSLNDDSATGNNTDYLSNTITLGDLIVNGSHNADTLSMLINNGSITWNISSPDAGTLSTVGLNGSFNNENTIDGSNNKDTYNLASTIGNLVGGSILNTLNTTNASGSDTWTITGANAGSISGTASVGHFSNMAVLTGSANGDVFDMSAGASVSGLVTALGGTLSYSGSSGTVSVNANTDQATGLAAGFSGFTKFIGDGAASSFTNTTASNTWNITGANAGNVAGDAFSNFGSLIAGNAETFDMMSGASLTGSVSASASILNYTNFAAPVTVNVFTHSATNVANFSGFVQFIGDAANGTISDTQGSQTWTMTGVNAGNVVGISFSNFNNISGGSADTFMMNAGSSIAGTVSASAATLNFSNYGSAITVNLGSHSATNVAGFSGFTQFIGSASSTFADTVGGNTWNVSASNAGSVAGVTYTGFANLSGGADTFMMMNGGSQSGTISATAGTLNYSSLTSTVNVNVGSHTATSVGSFSGITSFVGDGANSTMSDTSGGNTWTVSGANAGSIAGDSYTAFANLAGGSADIFMMKGGSQSGAVSATAGTVNYSNLTSTVSVNLTSKTATGLGSYSGITSFVGDGASSTISDTSGSSAWSVTGSNAGSVASTNFSGFANLTGGASDVFTLSNAAGVTGTISASSATLNYSAYTTPVTVNLGSNTATNVNAYSGITNLVGNNNASSTIDGANTTNTWNITGANAGNVNSTMTYSGFAYLMGGSGSDTFKFVPGGSEAFINGGTAGPDTLDYSGMGSTSVNITLQSLGSYHGFTGISSVGISNKFDNIDAAIGSSTATANTLTGPSTTAVWTITGVNTGNVVATNTFNFTNFPDLVGGGGTNTVSYTAGGSLTGSFTGASNGSNPANLIYNAPLTFNTNLTLTTTGTGSIIFNGGVTWTGAYTLTLDSANKIQFNSALSGVNGTLNLTAANVPQSITTSAAGSINVKNFNLIQGQWYQVGANLPAFNVTGNFQINSGNMPSSNAQFLRVEGGSGTSASPYQIFDIYGLQGVGSSTTLLADDFVMMNNINGSITSNWNSCVGFVPIGNNSNPFVGMFNGQNFTVSNITENRTVSSNQNDSVGLFGASNGATISNLQVSGSFTGESNVGSLVGTATNTVMTNDVSTAQDVLFNDGTIGLANAGVGGLVGELIGGSVISSKTSGSVTDESYGTEAGGLVGNNQNGSITNDTTTGQVINGLQNPNGNGGNCQITYNYVNNGCTTGNCNVGQQSYYESGNYNNVGGLVGYNGGTITGSHNTGSVSSIDGVSGANLGGLAGVNASTVTSSYNTGTIASGVNNTISSDFGGLFGENTGTASGSYNTGSITLGIDNHNSNVGGLAGVNMGSISSSYNTGSISVGLGSDNANIGSAVGYGASGSKLTTINNTAGISVGSGSLYDDVGGMIGLSLGSYSGFTNSGSVSISGSKSFDSVGSVVGSSSASNSGSSCRANGNDSDYDNWYLGSYSQKGSNNYYGSSDQGGNNYCSGNGNNNGFWG